jgi:hypothetical protein
MAAPILVTGSNRSGTTWLGRLLAEAEGTVFINELFNLDHPQPGLFGARFPHWFMYLDDDLGRPYVEPLRRALEFRYDWGDAARCLRSPRDAVRAARAYPRTRVPDGARPLLKDPIAVFSAPWLERAFGMQVVLTVRHPGGFAASLKRLDWRFDFANLTAQPRLMELLPDADRNLVDAYATSPPSIIHQAALLWRVIYGRPVGERWIVVRQEDLAADPQPGMRAIYEQLGLRWTDDVGEHVRLVTSAENPADAPEGRAHTRARNSAAVADAWRGRLDPDEVSLLRELTDQIATRFYPEIDW